MKNEKNSFNAYKTITLSISENLPLQEIKEIKSLFGKFQSRDVKCEIKKRELTIFLNSLDLRFLKAEVEKLKRRNTSKQLVNILDGIIIEIEKIRSYGLKGKKRVYVDYNKERKVKKRKIKEVGRNRYYYANNNNFSNLNVSMPTDYENKIICGDSHEVLKNLPDNCVDLIFTSPPYNFGLEYKAHYDANYWGEYFDKLFGVLDECIRVLKFGGRIIIDIQPLFSDYIPTHHIISNFLINKKLIWKGEILWEKHNYNCKYTAWGSWKSPSSPYLKYTWEFLEVFAKGTLEKDGNKDDIDITSEEFKEWVIAKWSIAPERNMEKWGHPAMFPEELALRVIKLFSYKNDVVLDPFNGVGTTTFVAKLLGRKYLGVDISEEYCSKARKRIEGIERKLF